MTISDPVRLVEAKWRYLGSERIDADGAHEATVPALATIVVITAETAAVRYTINGAANANSIPIPTDQTRVIGPLANLESLGIFNSGGSIAHVEYYCEA
ncbi:MAG: hypothetical protein J7M34_12125 [Anaerolineae bacterium]|nr:hypothetical protein [Anaerolineae bacterium]